MKVLCEGRSFSLSPFPSRPPEEKERKRKSEKERKGEKKVTKIIKALLLLSSSGSLGPLVFLLRLPLGLCERAVLLQFQKNFSYLAPSKSIHEIPA